MFIKYARLLPILLSWLMLCTCSPKFVPPGTMAHTAQLTDTTFISFDGSELPLKTWRPPQAPESVLIALHGYNDYSNFIKKTATYFAEQNIWVYAYDQRGFGAAPHRGKWSTIEAMCEDLRTIIKLVKERHADIPLYLLGDSMGGAVVMVAEEPQRPLQVDNTILVAPAVWSRSTMPFYQRWALWLGAHIIPWARVTSKGLNITPSDNKKMLKELGRDPLVIKESRIDALYGLTNLMDEACEASAHFNRKALFLYGQKDEIIPARPMANIFKKRSDTVSAPQRILVYKNGYHMLLRDIQAKVVWKDILFWLTSPAETFPSVQEKKAQEIKSIDDVELILRSDL